MGNNTGPIVLLGLLGLLLVLWLRRQQQPTVYAQASGGPGLYQTASGYVGAALNAPPAAVAYTGKLANATINTGASVVNTAIGAGASILNKGISAGGSVGSTLLGTGSSLIKSAGNTGASTGKSIVHTLSLGALF